MDKNNRIYTVLFTFLASFVFIFLITFVYLITRERINRNEALFERKAILKALDIPFSSDKQAYELYEKEIKQVKTEDPARRIFVSRAGGKLRYGAVFSGSGLWGTITGVLGVNGEISRITGLSVISHSETPGLGGRIDEAWFQKQFKSELIKKGSIDFAAAPGSGNYDPDDALVDGITGATRTSESMENLINKTLSFLNTLKLEGKL